MREGLRLLLGHTGTNCRLTSNVFPLKLQNNQPRNWHSSPLSEETISALLVAMRQVQRMAQIQAFRGCHPKAPGTGVSERVAAAAEIASCLSAFQNRARVPAWLGCSPSRID